MDFGLVLIGSRALRRIVYIFHRLSLDKGGVYNAYACVMLDEVSIERQLQREAAFEPPFCPRKKCSYHHPSKGRDRFWRKHGMMVLKRFPYAAQRFQCLACKATFSASLFRLHYRQKVWGLNFEIFRLRRNGATKRGISREIHRSERLVRTRFRNMARWAELKHAKLIEELKIEEPVVYDGLENFAFSQYDPNNINHAVGKRSLFVYDFNLAPLNRKGRMTEWQKRKKGDLEREHGKYPTDAIRTTTRAIFNRLLERCPKGLTLYTDDHFQYRRVVNIDLHEEKPITHLRTSSKVHRNFHNPLFAVNNIDLQARQNVSSFQRETISFSKHEISMQDDFLLYAVQRNYMRPKFWGTHRSDPQCSQRSPAMELKITDKIWSFEEFFQERVMPTHVKLNEDARARYERRCCFSRRTIANVSAF